MTTSKNTVVSQWRLGLDIGTNSLGWAALELAEGEDGRPMPIGLLDLGSRIFSDGRDPQSKESNAATRREPRGARRNRDRYLQRRSRFLRTLIEYGLMPQDADDRKTLEHLDPWILRARSLAEPLSPHELGRALFHLQQRRGFQSNRITDKGDDDKGKVATAAEKLRGELKNESATTLGELKGRPRQQAAQDNASLPKGQRQAMPLARVRSSGEGAKLAYDYYPMRAMIESEFDQIWAAQVRHNPDILTDKARDALRGCLLFQRPLKPQPVGRCTFEAEEERAPSALPSAQYLRILQELNHLRLTEGPGISARRLTFRERDELFAKLKTEEKISFKQLRKALGLSDAASFSLENAAGREHLDGNKTHAQMVKPRKGAANWKSWADLSSNEQDALIEMLIGRAKPGPSSHPAVRQTHQLVVGQIAVGLGISEQEAADLLEAKEPEDVGAFLSQRYDLDEDQVDSILSTRLPDGHGRLGRTAGAKVTTELLELDEAGALRSYDKAVLAAGYFSHSLLGTGEVFDQLPYYGEVLERSVAFGTKNSEDIDEKRIGKIANPTVHVALNQLRHVVNALIKRFGVPAEIVIELARDLPLSAKGKSDLEKRQKANRKKNEERAEELARFGQANTYNNRMLLRLWEELDATSRKCPFTGKHLSQNMLFSGELEIEHILPVSRTLDDGFNNKILALREANRRKGNRTPWEAVEKGIFDCETIENTMRDLKDTGKAWRFGPDAMARFEGEENGFQERQLNDTRYMSRLAKQYLDATGADVWVVNGRLTADLRHIWGLNTALTGHNRQPADSEACEVKKNRNDHRHHAVDAFVIACTDRRMVKAAADDAKRVEEEFTDGKRDTRRLLEDIPDPFPGHLQAVKECAGRIIVSHKPDHGIQGALHEGANYGVVETQAGEKRLAKRKPITDLTTGQIKNIGDNRIRRELTALTDGLSDKDRKQALLDYVNETGHKRVRVHMVQAHFEQIDHGPDSKGKRHMRAVIPGDNYCMDIVETANGEWKGVAVTRFEAHKPGWKKKWQHEYPDARMLMRVRNGDLLKLLHEGLEKVMRVVRLNPSANRLYLAEHQQAGALADRHKDDSDEFRWDLASISKLKGRKARLLRISPDGQIVDPGLTN